MADVVPLRANAEPSPVAAGDVVLLAGVRAGDAAALQALMDRHWSALVDYATGMLGGQDAAQDAVQEAFIRLWRRRARLGTEGSIRAYLYRLVRNLSVDELRRRRVRGSAPALLPEAELHAPAPDAVLREADLAARVEAAIEALPPRRREVFLLAHRHRLTYREIAELLDKSPQTVANQMSAALAHLREALADVDEA